MVERMRIRILSGLGIAVLPLMACSSGTQTGGNNPPPPQRGRAVCGPPMQSHAPPAAPPFQRCPQHQQMHSCGAMIDAPFMANATHQAQATQPGVCCYDMAQGDHWCRNMPPNADRAFRPAGVASAPLVAPAVARRDWARGSRGDDPRWLREAAAEHASIAAFASLALTLLEHGAPLDLISRAHAAAADEIAHAQICYALAGGGVGPAPLAALRLRSSVEEIAVETVIDGCFGETVAAVRAASEGLRRIADDESRHAELAFAILVWAMAQLPDDACVRVRDAARKIAPRDDLERQCLAEIVVPCVDAIYRDRSNAQSSASLRVSSAR